MINLKRRLFLRGSLAAGAITGALGGGLLIPRVVLAAWPSAAFQSKTVDGALDALVGSHQMQDTDKISFSKSAPPELAESSAQVPITVNTSLDNVESISIIVENNPSPLAASFVLGPGTEGMISTRVKMGKTSNVIALVKADGKLYSTRKEVKVTIGGCGG